jgi:GNAT superfamily N-acetyltransferase
VRITQYEHSHLPGVLALCEAEHWPTVPADPPRTHAVLTAPGVTSVVALDNDRVIGVAYLQSDGHIQAHLSLMAVSKPHRRQGIDRALLEYAAPLTGAQRIDLITDTAQQFILLPPPQTLHRLPHPPLANAIPHTNTARRTSTSNDRQPHARRRDVVQAPRSTTPQRVAGGPDGGTESRGPGRIGTHMHGFVSCRRSTR